MNDTVCARLVEPGIIYWVFDGTPRVEDLFQAAAEVREIMRQYPRPAVLCDARNLKEITAEIRHASRDAAQGVQLGAMAILGASFRMRVVLGLIVKAARLAKRQAPLDLMFASSEAEALAWLRRYVVRKARVNTE